MKRSCRSWFGRVLSSSVIAIVSSLAMDQFGPPGDTPQPVVQELSNVRSRRGRSQGLHQVKTVTCKSRFQLFSLMKEKRKFGAVRAQGVAKFISSRRDTG